MSKYLIQFSYTSSGVAGVLKEGGSSRRDAVRQLIESLGGKMDSFYFAFGEAGGYIISDFPDHSASVAATMLANSTGAVDVRTTVLLTAEELDQAAQRSGNYRPPGG